jgi:hypothetical protein
VAAQAGPHARLKPIARRHASAQRLHFRRKFTLLAGRVHRHAAQVGRHRWLHVRLKGAGR